MNIEDIKPRSKIPEMEHAERSERKLPKTKKKLVVLIVVGVLILAGAVSAHTLYQRYSFKKLENSAQAEFDNGNYSAALVLYNKLQDSAPNDGEIVSKVDNAKKLIVAEDTFLKAQQAAENEQWLDTEVLLKDSEAITNPDFKFYEDAKALYQKASDLMNSLEKQTAEEMTSLRQSIADEKSKRQQTESQLQTTSSQKQQTEQTLQNTQQVLQRTQNQAAQTQSQLEVQQKKAQEMEQKALQEQFEKFINELDVYVGMLKNGNGYLNSAISEIDRSSDVTALIYISQAKVLFDEVKTRAADLGANRTPAGYASRVDEVKQSCDLFNDAAKNLRNAIIYIESKESADFTNYLNQGKGSKSQAYSLAQNVGQFVSSSR